MRVRGANALLVDPLLPADPAEVLALVDEMASGEAAIDVYITIPYHVRSTLEIVERYGSQRVRVWGERRAAKRLAPQVEVRISEPGAELPFGGHCFQIGRPRRAELPLWIEDHAALAFGDALVTVDGELRVWSQDELDARRLAFLVSALSLEDVPVLTTRWGIPRILFALRGLRARVPRTRNVK